MKNCSRKALLGIALGGVILIAAAFMGIKFYNKLNYKEIDIVPCKFNGIEGVHLVLLEKKI